MLGEEAGGILDVWMLQDDRCSWTEMKKSLFVN
jgi:hypothetical protein